MRIACAPPVYQPAEQQYQEECHDADGRFNIVLAGKDQKQGQRKMWGVHILDPDRSVNVIRQRNCHGACLKPKVLWTRNWRAWR